MMGLFLGVLQAVSPLFEKMPNAARALVLLMAFLLGGATFLQAGTWRNLETLYQSIERNGGRLNRLNDATGMFYMQRGEFDKAIKMFQRAVEDPGGRAPNQMSDTHLRMGIAWLGVKANENESFTMVDIVNALPSCSHIAEAISEFDKAIKADPEGFKAHVILGAIYHYKGNDAEAVMHQQEVERILQKQKNPGP
jgi:lipopolysaccharide biosynthesis regulator YciM